MTSKICLIGDVVTDVSLPQNGDDIKVRLGGITHSARAFWSLNLNYSTKFISPDYLEKSTTDYFSIHGSKDISRIGVVTGAPYVFLIGSVKETGNQLYDFILRDQVKINFIEPELKKLNGFSDCLLVTGNFDYEKVLEKLDFKCNVHADLSNSISSISELKNNKFETIFISTSSELFLKNYNNSFVKFCHLFKDHCNVIVLKENRGGSRIYNFKTESTYKIPANTQPIVHSVGVGDAYDACFISKYKELGIESAAYLSSWVASEYACTTYPDDLKRNVGRILKTGVEVLKSLGGCSLPWEDRKLFPIYIAAPDFDYLDTSKIDELCESLNYHNFYPRRPVKENGQLTIETEKEERHNIYKKDISLLNECKLLIVVYINDDTGTMIELGYAKALGLPCLVFDPYKKAYNCMLTEIPLLVSSDLDEILSETFNQLSKLNGK
jgi:nucleoside 2-deoxyribosyltransferase